MAIYHLNVKTGSRDGGQSARARAQYIAREGKDEKDRDELAHNESGNMPQWAADDPRQYWAAADAHERVNGRLFVEVECALPKELNAAQQRTLAHEASPPNSPEGNGCPTRWPSAGAAGRIPTSA